MVRVEVLTAPGCRKCEAAKALVVNTIARLRQEIPDLKVEVINLADHPEVAVQYRVMATPAIAINGVLAFSGTPKEADLRQRLLEAARG